MAFRGHSEIFILRISMLGRNFSRSHCGDDLEFTIQNGLRPSISDRCKRFFFRIIKTIKFPINKWRVIINSFTFEPIKKMYTKKCTFNKNITFSTLNPQINFQSTLITF